MRASFFVSAIAAGLLWFALVTQAQSSDAASGDKGARSIYITHVTVVDTATGKELANRTVVVSGDRITEVKESKGLKLPEGAKVVDGRGKYLIPGLWDMHAHATDNVSTYPLYLVNGVTGVREMSGPPDANRFRAELAAKNVDSPHMYIGSAIVDGPPPLWPDTITVNTPDDARRVVDEQKRKGADFIKIYNGLSREAYFAILDEGKRLRIPVEGHVPFAVSGWEATAAGQKSFEHLFGIPDACSTEEEELRPKIAAAKRPIQRDRLYAQASLSYSDEKCRRLFAAFNKNHTWQVPTLTIDRSVGWLRDPQFTNDDRLRYFSGEMLSWISAKDGVPPYMKDWTEADYLIERELFVYDQKLVGAMFRAGVPLLAGTDDANPYCFPGFSLHDELALLVESGLTPLAALQAATANAAKFMDASDRYGTIATGMIADLVLLDADPLQDIHNTTKIAEVFLAGKEFNRHDLDAILSSAVNAANANAVPSGSAPQPAPEMQGLESALAGRWSITEKFEPDEWTPNGGTGYGEEVWRRGPGGFTFMEEIHDHTAFEEGYGLGLSWWDKTKGLQGLWCINTNQQGCDLQNVQSGFGPKWDGRQLVVDMEFPRNGKTLAWHEVFSDITPTSFVQTADIGEKGGPLKRWLTIHATKVEEWGPLDAADFRAAVAKRHQAMIDGDEGTVDRLTAKEYAQTDIFGRVQDKTSWMNEYFRPLAALIKSGKFRWERYEERDVRVTMVGGTAVVTGALAMKGAGAKITQGKWEEAAGASIEGTFRFTRVWIKRDGTWLLAAVHNSVPMGVR